MYRHLDKERVNYIPEKRRKKKNEDYSNNEKGVPNSRTRIIFYGKEEEYRRFRNGNKKANLKYLYIEQGNLNGLTKAIKPKGDTLLYLEKKGEMAREIRDIIERVGFEGNKVLFFDSGLSIKIDS